MCKQVTLTAKKLQFKNDTKIFSALNRQKNKNIRSAPEKQHSDDI